VFERNSFRDQLRFEQQQPESIRKAGEVMTGLRRANAGIDADKQHANAGADAIA
jgi:hypothetical protein